ncbi:MAG: SusC/RagA family TonB-linked outer membrane protein, partial [Pedobacter sp.]
IMKKKLLILVLALLCLNFMSKAQQPNTIQGTITTAADNKPLPGASVKIKTTNTSTQTDQQGKFTLTTSTTEGILLISYTGYQTQEVPFNATNRTNITIQLQETRSDLEQIQIIGYGQTTKRLNTGSISSISAKQIEQQPVTNVLSAMSGRMPGVFVQTTNGLPGGNINIQIRGKGSITAGTNPLYIIDGVPFESAGVAAGTSLATTSMMGAISPLNSLNPADIESISVLKDADATAIYGSRGANGVILITTKKGKQNTTKANISLSSGINQAAGLPNFLSLDEFLTIRREAFANDGKIPSTDPTNANYAPDLTVWSSSQSTNWAEYLFGGTGHVNTLQASLSGGNANTSFTINGNYRTESTMLPGDNKYKRGGTLLSLHHQSDNKKFTADISNTISIDQNNTVNPSNSFSSLLGIAPNFPLKDESGNFNWYFFQNPMAQLLATNTVKTNNLVSSIRLNYEFIPGLAFKTSMGYNKIQVDQAQLYPTLSLRPGTANYGQYGKNSNQSVIIEPQLTYERNFKKSILSLLLGATYQNRLGESQYIKASNFSNDALMENLTSAGTIDNRNTTSTDYRYASLYGRINYNIADKYILNATMRRDGSSKFGPGNQYGNFGAVGAAWIVSNEAWMKAVQFLSYFKLRGSFGLIGNDQITDYQYLSTYSTSGLVYQNIAALAPSRISNANFKWETTRKLEMAAELGFINNRLMLNIAHYLNRSDDQLVNYSLPRITGFASYQANLPALVQNTGWEFELSTTNSLHKTFSWKTSFNITLPKNRLKSFENFQSSSYAQTLQIGYDITRIYGAGLLEVNPETGKASYVIVSGSSNPNTYQTIGKQTPDAYGGIGNTFSLHNWELDIFGQFARQMAQGGISHTPGSIRNGYKATLNRWQGTGDQTNMPKASLVNDPYYTLSSANFFDASYFRLKNVSLSWSVPNRWLSKAGMSQLRIYTQLQNIFTLSDKDAPFADPESGAISSSSINIPPVKSIVFGLNVTL